MGDTSRKEVRFEEGAGEHLGDIVGTRSSEAWRSNASGLDADRVEEVGRRTEEDGGRGAAKRDEPRQGEGSGERRGEEG